MVQKSFAKQIDDILDSLYEAADVPNIDRRYIGRQFMELLEKTVDQSIIDYMRSVYIPPTGIRDLEKNVKVLQERVDQMESALAEITHES